MTSAAREVLQRRAGLAAIAECKKQHGALSEKEMDQARRDVGTVENVSIGPAAGVSTVAHDAGALVAADRNNRRTWAEHRARLEFGIIPSVSPPVLAQISRSAQQAQLRRFLTGCAVVAVGESELHEAGRLLGKTGTADVVDTFVVTVALRENGIILTSDPDRLKRLVRGLRREVTIIPV